MPEPVWSSDVMKKAWQKRGSKSMPPPNGRSDSNTGSRYRDPNRDRDRNRRESQEFDPDSDFDWSDVLNIRIAAKRYTCPIANGYSFALTRRCSIIVHRDRRRTRPPKWALPGLWVLYYWPTFRGRVQVSEAGFRVQVSGGPPASGRMEHRNETGFLRIEYRYRGRGRGRFRYR